MKVFAKHARKPGGAEERLRACLDEEIKKFGSLYLRAIHQELDPRVVEILESAERFLTRAQVHAILGEYLPQPHTSKWPNSKKET